MEPIKVPQEISSRATTKFWDDSDKKYGKAAPLVAIGVAASAILRFMGKQLFKIARWVYTHPDQVARICYKISIWGPRLKKLYDAGQWLAIADTVVDIINDLKNDNIEQIPVDIKPIEVDILLWIASQLGFDVSAIENYLNHGSGIHFRAVYKAGQDFSAEWFKNTSYGYGKGKYSEEIKKTDEPNVVRTIEKLSLNKEIWDRIPDYTKPNYKTDSIMVLKAKFMAIDSQLGTSYYQEAFGEPLDIGYIEADTSDDDTFTLPPSVLEQTPSYDIPYLGAGVIKSKFQEINKCGPQDVGCGFGKGILHDMDFDEMKNTYSAFNESNKTDTDNYIQNWKAEPVSVIRSKLEAQMQNTAIDKPYQEPKSNYEESNAVTQTKSINKVEDVIQQMQDDGTWSQIPEYNRPTSDDSINVIRAKLDTINKQFGTNYGLGKYGKAAPLIIAGLDSLIVSARSTILPKLIQRYGQTQALQIYNRIQLLVPKLAEVLKAIGIVLDVATLGNLIDTASQFLDEHKWMSYSNDDLLALLLDIAKKVGINFASKRIFGFGKPTYNFKTSDYTSFTKYRPPSSKSLFDSKSLNFYPHLLKPKTRTIYDLSSEELINKVKDLQASPKWDTIPDYNKPDIENDNQTTIREKLRVIEEVKNTSIDTPSIEAKKISDQIQNAKTKTEKIIQDIKTSLRSSVSTTTETNQSQTKEIPQMTQPTNISENLNKEQLEQLIKEQQQTNNLLLKLIEAIMTSGKSIENSIMNNAPSQSGTTTNPVPMQRGSMISGIDENIPVNNNIHNVLRALNMFGSGNN